MDTASFMNDPHWADFIPDLNPAGPACHLPAHEDCSPLDVDATTRPLEPGGALGSMPGYESRPGQLDVLRAVTRAFNDRVHLMIEAGTGTGKSLAYLIPAVRWSFLNDTPVVISTATRNLQSQLISSDLPRAVSTLGTDAARFRFALLKGRSNYLCLRAMADLMQDGPFAFTEAEQNAFERLVTWLHRTPDGDLDTLDADELRPRLFCPPEDCIGKICPYAAKCFIAKARARAVKAHVVVVNHALILAEATSPGAGILPAYGRLILDEAHNLEDIATGFFSYELSRATLTLLIGRLSRKTSGRRSWRRGVLGAIERQLEKGAFHVTSVAEEIRELTGRAHVQCGFVLQSGDVLLDVLERLFAPAPDEERLRFRCAPGRQYARHGIFCDYTPLQWDEAELAAAATRFESVLADLQNILTRLSAVLQEADDPEKTPAAGDLTIQVQSLAASFTQFILESKFILAASDPSRVYWIERVAANRKARSPASVRLVAAPLSVAAEMKRCFYDAKDSVILCSATLRVGDKFLYMAQKLGLSSVEPARVRALVAASPFDFFRQTLVLAPDCLPDPATHPFDYATHLAPFLRDLFVAVRGRGLVLFTAYEMMRSVAHEAGPAFEAAGIRLVVQGDGLSRENMVALLKNAPEKPVVLFGAQSFWEGVDVPGDALSCVVIARLPFPQVGEPIVEARGDKVVEEGGSSFRDYFLPEAVIRFRQGFGRLVRTRTDHGVVVIADTRIVTKNYGALFRKSVPATVHTISDLTELIARAGAFFDPSETPLPFTPPPMIEKKKKGSRKRKSSNDKKTRE